MADQNVREIQLGGKQLVFLFMASVVVAVAIFLLGISVGRGVGSPVTEASSGAVEPAPSAPVEMPPPTKPTDDDLNYHDKLAGTTPAKPEPEAPAPKPTAKEDPKTTAPAPAETTSVAVKPPAATPPPAAPATMATSTRGTPPPGSGWFVQVAAFKSRENADKQVAQLKAKGHAAFVQADAGALFRVRIGPYKERSDAAQTAEQLQREDQIRATVGR